MHLIEEHLASLKIDQKPNLSFNLDYFLILVPLNCNLFRIKRSLNLDLNLNVFLLRKHLEKMNFAENPKLFIMDYYYDKRNQIDLNCEKVLLEIEVGTKKEVSAYQRTELNDLRMDLINRIESAKETVLKRYDALESQYAEEMLHKDPKLIKDEIFSDQYCTILDVNVMYILFDLKLGVLLFSEYDDHLVENLRKKL